MKDQLFRERSITVQAYRFSPDEPFPLFVHTALLAGDVWYQGGSEPYLTIKTGRGGAQVHVGDWVFRTVDNSNFQIPEPEYGPLQVASDEMFRQRYEPI